MNAAIRIYSGKIATLAAIGLFIFIVSGKDSQAEIHYPASKTVSVVDTLHGNPVPDPYRWLENTDDPAVQSWTDQQNALTRSLLDSLPVRSEILSDLERLWNYSRMGTPHKRGGKYFFEYNDGLQDQDVLYMASELHGERTVLIDPNKLSEEGIVAMDWWYPSHDGSKIAYGLSEKGSENSTTYIFDVEAQQNLPYSIDRCRYPSLTWLPNSDGFLYTRNPEPGTVPEGEGSYHKRVFIHMLGNNPDNDRMIFEHEEEPTWPPAVMLAEDNETILFYVYQGSAGGQKLYYSKLDTPDQVIQIADKYGIDYLVHTTPEKLFIHTNDDAPFYKVMVTDLSNPEKENWRELIPERDYLLEGIAVSGNHLALRYLHDVSSKLEICDLDGSNPREIELEGLGSIGKLVGEWDAPELFFTYTTFLTPRGVRRVDVRSGELSVVHNPKVDFDPDRYEVKQEWYESADGTKVPMFIVHTKGIQLDGSNPTLLYGYGGFQQNQNPYFSGSRLVWLKRGGVFALPALRGGSEFGEEWHKAGMLAEKQNTFDDFIAAAEHLIERGYTRTEKLAIYGGSNGGLLVGACLVQRPDLYRAVICTVPLLDMIRFHKFLIAKYWTPEYGNAEENPEHFEFMRAYSPYHNIKDGVNYPATFVKAGEADGRVHPLHARKFAAALQKATSGGEPILLWIDRKGGHGQGMPISLSMQGVADIYTFLLWQLGLLD